MLPTDAKARKAIPIWSGFFKYFPRAIAAVAELSRAGNDQHNPGKPLHWDRSKSGDELDAQARHMLDMALQGEGAADTDAAYHATKNAWRAMANLEKLLEKTDDRRFNEPDDGWLPWIGGRVPPTGDVFLRLASGTVTKGPASAVDFNWDVKGESWSIVAWKPA